jgi:hypothetical protein
LFFLSSPLLSSPLLILVFTELLNVQVSSVEFLSASHRIFFELFFSPKISLNISNPRSLFRSFVCSFVRSFVLSFVRLFFRSFVGLSSQVESEWPALQMILICFPSFDVNIQTFFSFLTFSLFPHY